MKFNLLNFQTYTLSNVPSSKIYKLQTYRLPTGTNLQNLTVQSYFKLSSLQTFKLSLVRAFKIQTVRRSHFQSVNILNLSSLRLRGGLGVAGTVEEL